MSVLTSLAEAAGLSLVALLMSAAVYRSLRLWGNRGYQYPRGIALFLALSGVTVAALALVFFLQNTSTALRPFGLLAVILSLVCVYPAPRKKVAPQG